MKVYEKVMKYLTEYVEKPANGERTYLIALGMYLIYNIWITTMMDQVGVLNAALNIYQWS